DLIREQRQQAQLVGLERADAALARLAVRGREHADDRVVAALDRNGHERLAAGEETIAAALERQRLPLAHQLFAQLALEKIGAHVAERAIERVAARLLAQKQRRAARVGERDHAEQDLVRELVDVEGRGDGEAD